MRNQVFKKLFSVLLALIMVAGLLPASAMAGGWGAMDVDTTPELTETEQPTESAEPTAPTETETPEVTEVPELTPENPAATDESTQEITIAPVNEVAVLADDGVTDGTTVIAGSDFQNKSGDEAGAATVTSILTQIQKDYTSVDGFLFAGDYDQDTHNSNTEVTKGITALMQAVQDKYTNINYDNTILVQGNHDNAHNAIDATGGHDFDGYGTFVLNEDDYPDGNSSSSGVQSLAVNLTEYLNGRLETAPNEPVFVVSHLPLHYSYRTYNNGNGVYAKYLYDAMYAAADKGLTIFFLFGHNHSGDHDSYLGGSSIFLTPEDSIWLCQPGKQQSKPEEHPLNFYYMNAGYVGYSADDADNTLTMTTFEITDNSIVVNRYDTEGKHNLKSAGRYNASNDDSGYGYPVYTKVVKSPYTVPMVANVTLTDEPTGTVVTAPGITGINVTTSTANPNKDMYSGYLTYDITLYGYTQGHKATVSVKVNSQFDLNRTVQVVDVKNSKVIATTSIDKNGMVTFTTNHFSAYAVMQLDASAATTVEGTLASASLNQITTQNGLVNDPDNPHAYVIVANEGDDATLTNIASGDGLQLVNGIDTRYLWYYSERGEGIPYFHFGSYNNSNDGDGWLKVSATDGAASVGNSDNRANKIVANGDGTFSIYRKIDEKNRYLNRYGGETSMVAGSYTKNNNGSKWKIYEVTQGSGAPVTLTVGPTSNTIRAEDTFKYTPVVTAGGEETSTYTISWSTSNSAVATVSGGVVTGVSDGTATITATLTKANGENLEKAISVDMTVNVVTKEIASITLNETEAEVARGSGTYVKTGATMTVTYDDGSSEVIDITVGMLSGDLNVKANGTYEDLTVTYGGQTAGGFTLRVIDVAGNNYPEYPNEGAVRVGKTGEDIDFQSSGIAKVELTATGVPVKKGADVIVMLDTSSSVKDWCICGTKNCGQSSADGDYVEGAEHMRRNVILEESLKNLIAQFKTPGDDGQVLDIDVAIADFNRFYTDESSPYRWDDTDKLTEWGEYTGGDAPNYVYTGTGAIEAGAFVPAKELANTYNLNYQSGTNYDYAFDVIYQLGHAAQVRNAQAGVERDLYVVFLSDGAPYQYNYFKSNDQDLWNNWLQGTIKDDMYATGANKNYYNEVNGIHKHRMAEAIKGSPDEKYTIIRKNLTGFDTVDTTQTTYDSNMYTVPGLGATMFSIAFCPADDGKTSRESMLEVIQSIASEQTGTTPYYYEVDSAKELRSAFTAIGNEIAYAATNARFVDTMGADYDLQMKSSTYTLSDGTTTKTITPEIIVQAYDIYTKADNVAESEIGKRKGTSTVLEKVTFNEGGTEAYSDKKSGNILVDGVICANTFWYNTTGSTVSIDTNGDGTNDYNLAPETFYWKMGTINQTELALSYYVYLTGSMEGTRAAGSYPTNESATLHYTNWLGNEAKKDTVSPVMPWESANVSYAFYLVDGEGKPVTNQTTGATGSFANAVKVTQPVVYSEVLLNSGAEVEANIVARNALPAGYELYDADAAYTVSVRSGDGTGSWTITKGGSVAATTYVAQYDPNNSAAVSNALLSTEVNGGQNDYTHTVVWFAVKYQISCVPDAVVIDFGLPVDISVLANDILGEGAAVVGLAAVDSIPATQGTEVLATEFSTGEYTGTYGTATIHGTKVRYTPGSMKMDNTEKFAYAAKANLENDQKYYYSTVTVIPAANIYYEDSFVTFDGAWEPVGQAKDGITQQEDRPGQFSLSAYDANNVYGFDSAYTACTEYSLGSAKVVTVNSATNANPPTATFTFKGTGFDLISLTSNTTGTILVDVYNGNKATGEAAHKWIVDTYYGYTRTDDGYNKYTWTKGEDGKWHVTKEKVDTLPDGAVLDGTPVNSGDVTYSRNYKWAVTKDTNNALYQIPVIRGQGLEYDTYTVVITPKYSSARDHAGKGSYDFYLDAVRIYDPAGKNPDGEIGDAYKADGEGWPEIIELRNLLIDAGKLRVDKDAAIVFVDGKAAAELTDYTNFGPNNEVYLANGQAIAFKLSVADPSNIASIQLAAKSPNGGATAKVNADGTETPIATATEMYYTITHRVTWGSGTAGESNTIVVANIGNNILSLTNIKITYKQQPTASTQAVAIVDNEVVEQAPAMLLSMMGIKDPEPEPEPEPEETFEPDRFEASWSRNVMQGRKATLTVKTSEDVEAITVDGQTIRSYRTRTERVGFGRRAKRITYREFTYSMVAQETADFSVTAINAEGTESEAIIARLTVQKRPESIRDVWNWFKGWF